MKAFLLSLLVIPISFFQANASEILRGKAANEAVQGAEVVRFKSFSQIPAYIKFRPAEQIDYASWESWMRQRYFKDQENIGFQLIGSEEDQLGMTHYRYQQTADDRKVSFGVWIVHTLNGKVVSMNGELFEEVSSQNATLDESTALEYALDFMGAETYKWELPREESWLKIEQDDPNATYFPTGTLEYVNADPSLQEVDLQLAWRFNVYAHAPLARKDVYVNAQNGNIVFANDLIHHADSNGVAETGYSGQQNIVADYTGSVFRLREDGRGNGIETYDMNNGTDYGSASDFEDNDNYWNTTAIERFGTDAHWGAEMTYDYYWNHYNRNSINGNGFTLRSYVHYNTNYGNAFWDGQRMTYGDGSNGDAPFTALDIAGHEVTHGLTTFTAGLIYQNESGALNESFSDIFGAAIEFDALGFSNGDWLMGEDLGFIIRSMSNPNVLGDPDCYKGTYWYTGTGDNGGVHINSGVQNFWFYLLTVGGSGTNDFGNSYSVTGIGIEDAGAIAYRNLVTYLTAGSQYEDARFYAIEAALDLFGPCSQQVISTGNAWYAVGLGDPYPSEAHAEFESNGGEACVLPYEVSFENLSANATSYIWDFGDGTTSNALQPTHTYTQQGTFTVRLTVSSTCGTDSMEMVDLVNIELTDPPTADGDEICPDETATLTASSNGAHRWYDSPISTTYLHEGDTFITPPIQVNTPYFVETIDYSPTESVGPVDNTIGGGVYFQFQQGLIFDAQSSFILESVDVFSLINAERRIVILNQLGDTAHQKVVQIPNGAYTVDLDFEIAAGSNYLFTIGDDYPINLYRNNEGVDYPYEIGGVVSIKESTASSDPYGYYYYYYNWQVKGFCASERVEVVANTSICLGFDEKVMSSQFEVYPNPNNGQFQVSWTDALAPERMNVRNIQGQVVHTQELSTDGNQHSLDLGSVAQGVYMLEMVSAQGSATKQLVIQ